VTIDAAIKNSGFRSIDTTVAFYVDGNLLSIEDVNVEANKTEHVAVIWDGLPDIKDDHWRHYQCGSNYTK
jgi:hypothetical protein